MAMLHSDPDSADDTEKYKTMTLEEATAELSKAVYHATRPLERLEGAGHLTGNGHHARQKIATAAVDDLRRRWK